VGVGVTRKNIRECSRCKGVGTADLDQDKPCCECGGTAIDLAQFKSKCEHYGAEYQCSITTCNIMEYKTECTRLLGRSDFRLLSRWEKQVLNRSFKKGRDKERGF